MLARPELRAHRLARYASRIDTPEMHSGHLTAEDRTRTSRQVCLVARESLQPKGEHFAAVGRTTGSGDNKTRNVHCANSNYVVGFVRSGLRSMRLGPRPEL
jgi:hypothetical protein